MRRSDAGHGEQQHGKSAADHAALQPQHQEVPLEMTRDETVFGADKMQHLDDRPIGRHRASRGEGHREHGRRQHQDHEPDAADDGGLCHGSHPLDEGAVIVEAGAGDLFGQRPFQRC